MGRASNTVICIVISIFLASCQTGIFNPDSIPIQTPPENTPPVEKTALAQTPSLVITATNTEPPFSDIALDVLGDAVANLKNASSFEIRAHDVVAYQIQAASGAGSLVYGEFNSTFIVIRHPLLKVQANHDYRYDPMVDFSGYDSYTFQENDQYFTKLIDTDGTSTVSEIELDSIAPFTGDIYQTLITYSGQAKYVADNKGIAVYLLEHPKWYQLEGAIGFADLGFLHGQENSTQLIEQYVAEHYPHVETIVFRIYVSVEDRLITKVEVDKRDFMLSLWEEIDRALVEQGVAAESLTHYQLLDDHGADYLFSNYDQVQDFDIPQ